ncbi:SDR family oxidoreductase [Cellulomonas marina]|uniref:NAD(P)H dehydrogenase (Quinone) n=1 Tax=Cellulomonas marina TaxID=988821 RepID=A0A1I0YYE1_9CELL|nr:SDR family oxidoreductase [Cellulomonas marina]GIG28108.1 NAD(P)-dependent oxidoreductase [Cellulomonas marina]SFB18301.1 NAD(P)H dehydrogenase (quinone) [Cellulomonas marina]
MSYVVTGATGHLGRLVVAELLARGVPAGEITATGRRADALADLAAQGVRTVVADYADGAALKDAFSGADVLVLVSGSEVGQRVDQHRNALEAARDAGVRRVVYTSAPHADTTALVLAPEHKATEELVRASGLVWTVVRNNWHTENYEGTFAQARDTGEVVTSTSQGRVASATRADYAAGAAAVAVGEGHEGRVYELSGDTAWTFDEFAATAADVLGRPVVHRAVTPDEHRAALTGAGLDEGTAGFVVALDEGIARGDLADATTDLATLIGRPTTPLAETLRSWV